MDAGNNKRWRTSRYFQETVEFLDAAYRDYLAARVLLNSGLPLPGAILASTAIEKYCKAFLAFSGQKSHGHLKQAHMNATKKLNLNISFLKLLRKCHQLRYLDSLPNGFNVVIASREFLAEIDETAIKFQENYQITNKGEKRVARYDYHRESNDHRLIHRNFVLTDLDKQAFISAEPQLVFEFRKTHPGEFYEVEYFTSAAVSDGVFLREGFAPMDETGLKFRFSFTPSEDKN